jgi:hypothetical protein
LLFNHQQLKEHLYNFVNAHNFSKRLKTLNGLVDGYHNLKRLVPKSEAYAFARNRGDRWVEAHLPAIQEYMKGRCEIIPMRDVVADETYQERIPSIFILSNQSFKRDWGFKTSHVNGWYQSLLMRFFTEKASDAALGFMAGWRWRMSKTSV